MEVEDDVQRVRPGPVEGSEDVRPGARYVGCERGGEVGVGGRQRDRPVAHGDPLLSEYGLAVESRLVDGTYRTWLRPAALMALKSLSVIQVFQCRSRAARATARSCS